MAKPTEKEATLTMKNTMTSSEITHELNSMPRLEQKADGALIDLVSFQNFKNKQWLSKEYVEKCIYELPLFSNPYDKEKLKQKLEQQ